MWVMTVQDRREVKPVTGDVPEMPDDVPEVTGDVPGYAIRKSVESDMPACARVLAPAFADKVEAIVGDMEKSYRIIPTVMRLMNGEVWVAEALDGGRDGNENGEVMGAIVITTEEPKFLMGSVWICLKTLGIMGTIRAFSLIRDYMRSAPGRLDGEGILEAVGVSEEWGGKGIGAALVNKAADHLRENGRRFFGLGVKADSPAVRLYERLDFLKQGEYSNRLGNWFYMRKDL